MMTMKRKGDFEHGTEQNRGFREQENPADLAQRGVVFFCGGCVRGVDGQPGRRRILEKDETAAQGRRR